MKKPPAVENLVSAEHCALFDERMKHWQGVLNLNHWRIERSPGRPRGVMADVAFDGEAMLANYRIGRSFGGAPVTPETIDATALHESLHILLYDLRTNPSDVTEHGVINVVEKLLMERKP